MPRKKLTSHPEKLVKVLINVSCFLPLHLQSKYISLTLRIQAFDEVRWIVLQNIQPGTNHEIKLWIVADDLLKIAFITIILNILIEVMIEKLLLLLVEAAVVAVVIVKLYKSS